MRILIACAAWLSALFVLGKVIAAYDRRLMLVEYGTGIRTCESCGRACFGVRRRAAVGEAWGRWCSECCNGELLGAGR
jgi:hypothetical protein